MSVPQRVSSHIQAQFTAASCVRLFWDSLDPMTQHSVGPYYIKSETTHFSAIDEIQDKVQLVRCLEGVVQSNQKWVFHVLQKHIAFRHDVFLLLKVGGML